MARGFVGHAQQRRRVHGDEPLRLVLELEGLAAVLQDLHRLAEDGEHRGPAHRDDYPWTDQPPLVLQPPAAGGDLSPVGGLVQPSLASRLVLEVLDGVGDIGAGALDAGLGQGAVEKAPGGSHERSALEVLLVARLLAHQHHRGLGRTFAGHALGGVSPEIAAPAALDRLGDGGEGARLRRGAFPTPCCGEIGHTGRTRDQRVRLPGLARAD